MTLKFRLSPRIRATGLLLVLALAPGAAVHAASFREVRERVYAEPLTQFPTYDLPLGRIIFHALLDMGGVLIDRARATLSSQADFKERAPKVIHTVGICAEGTWTIHSASFATGLLAPNADGSPVSVRALARFSIATNAPVYKRGTKRNAGIAIKLFPTADENESVTTRNVFTLDQTGLTGADRPSFFFASDSSDPEAIFFTNSVEGTGFLSWLGQRTFEKLDPPSTIRALYPLAEVTASGQAVAGAAAPRLIRFYPRMAQVPGPVPADFRAEILSYGRMRFDIVLPAQYGVPQDKTIGSLELANPVVSTVCDEELTFHHSPENRALEESP